MFNFSKKYNIKINTTDNIVKILSNNILINEEENFNKYELYLIKNTYDLRKISEFSDIKNYVIISNESDKIELRLYENELYTVSLNDIYTAAELLLIFGYEVAFGVNNKIYKYRYKNIIFYIQFVNENSYFLTFNETTNEEDINKIIDLFKNKLNMSLDNKLYFDIIQNEFNSLK